MTNNYQVIMICKGRSLYTSLLFKYFKNNNIDCKIIYDYPIKNFQNQDIICYDDFDLVKDGFSNLTMLDRIKKPGAWEKAFYYLKDNQCYDYYYIMEDDVYSGNLNIFVEFFKKTEKYKSDLIAVDIYSQEEDIDWPFKGFRIA
jgi:hypothetical protein